MKKKILFVNNQSKTGSIWNLKAKYRRKRRFLNSSEVDINKNSKSLPDASAQQNNQSIEKLIESTQQKQKSGDNIETVKTSSNISSGLKSVQSAPALISLKSSIEEDEESFF